MPELSAIIKQQLDILLNPNATASVENLQQTQAEVTQLLQQYCEEEFQKESAMNTYFSYLDKLEAAINEKSSLAASSSRAPAPLPPVPPADIQPMNVLLDQQAEPINAVAPRLPINEVQLDNFTLAFARRRSPQVAPQVIAANAIPPEILFIIDRSGSMGGHRIAAAQRILAATKAQGCLVRVVVFDHECRESDIIENWNGDNLRLGGTTDISSGLDQGFNYVKKLLNKNGHEGLRVIFLSDGYANTASNTFHTKLSAWNTEAQAVPAGVFANLIDEFGQINPIQPRTDRYPSALVATQAMAIAIGNYFKARGLSQSILCHVVNMGGSGDTVNFTGLAAALGGNNSLLTEYSDAELATIAQASQAELAPRAPGQQPSKAQELLSKVMNEITPLLGQRVARLPMNVRGFNATELLESGQLGQAALLTDHFCAVLVPADGNYDEFNDQVEVLSIEQLLNLDDNEELHIELTHILESLNQFANRIDLNFTRYSNLVKLLQEAESKTYQKAILGRVVNMIRFMERFQTQAKTQLAIWMSRRHPAMTEYLEQIGCIYSSHQNIWIPNPTLASQLIAEGYQNQKGKWVKVNARRSGIDKPYPYFMHEHVHLLNEVNGYSTNPYFMSTIIHSGLVEEVLHNPLEQFIPLIQTIISKLKTTEQTYSKQFTLAADCDPVRFSQLMQAQPLQVAHNLASKQEQQRNRGFTQQLIHLLDPANFLNFLQEILENVSNLNPYLLEFLNAEINLMTQGRFSDTWMELTILMRKLIQHPELTTPDQQVSFLLELRPGESFAAMPLRYKLNRIMNFLPQQGRAMVLTQIGEGNETSSFYLHPLRQRHMVNWATNEFGQIAVLEVAHILQIRNDVIQDELKEYTGLSDAFIEATSTSTRPRFVCAVLRPEQLYSPEAMRFADPEKHFRKRTAARITSAATFGQIAEPQARHNISYHHHTFHVLFTLFQRFAAIGVVPDDRHLPDDDLAFFVATAMTAFSPEDSACRRLLEELATLPGEETYTVNLLGEFLNQDSGLHADSDLPVRAILSYLTHFTTSRHPLHRAQLSQERLQQIFYSLVARVVKHSNVNTQQARADHILPETASFAPYTDATQRVIDPSTQLAYIAFLFFLIEDLRDNPFHPGKYQPIRGSELDMCTHLRAAFVRVQAKLNVNRYSSLPVDRDQRVARAATFNENLMRSFAIALGFRANIQLNEAILYTLRQGQNTKIYPLYTSGNQYQQLRYGPSAAHQLLESTQQEHLQHLYNLVSAGIAFPSIFEKLWVTEAGTHADREAWLADLKQEVKRLSNMTPIYIVDILPAEADCELGAYYVINNINARDLLYHNHKKKGLINIPLSQLSKLTYKGLEKFSYLDRKKFVNIAFSQLHNSITPPTKLVLFKPKKPTTRVEKLYAQLCQMDDETLSKNPEYRHLVSLLAKNPFAVFYRRLEHDGSIAPIQLPVNVSCYVIVYNEASAEHHLRYYPVTSNARDLSHWMPIPLSALPDLEAFAQDSKRANSSWLSEIKIENNEFLSANGPWPTDKLSMNRIPGDLVEAFTVFHVSDMRKLREVIWQGGSVDEVLDLVQQLTLTPPFSLIKAPCNIAELSKHLLKAAPRYSSKRNEEALNQWINLIRQAIRHCQSNGQKNSDYLLRIAQDVVCRLERAPKNSQAWTTIAIANKLIALQHNPHLKLACLESLWNVPSNPQGIEIFRAGLPRLALIGLTAMPQKQQAAFLNKLEEMTLKIIRQDCGWPVEVFYYLARFLGFQFKSLQPEDFTNLNLIFTYEQLIEDLAIPTAHLPFGSTRTYSKAILVKFAEILRKRFDPQLLQELINRFKAQEAMDSPICQVIQDPITTQLEALLARAHSPVVSKLRLSTINRIRSRRILSIKTKKALLTELEVLHTQIAQIESSAEVKAAQTVRNRLLEDDEQLKLAIDQVQQQRKANIKPYEYSLLGNNPVNLDYAKNVKNYKKASQECAKLADEITAIYVNIQTFTKLSPLYQYLADTRRFAGKYYDGLRAANQMPDLNHPSYQEGLREIYDRAAKIKRIYDNDWIAWQEKDNSFQPRVDELNAQRHLITTQLEQANIHFKPLLPLTKQRETIVAQLKLFKKHIPNLNAKIAAPRQKNKKLKAEQNIQIIKTLLKILNLAYDHEATTLDRIIESVKNSSALVESDKKFQQRCMVHLFERNLTMQEVHHRLTCHLNQEVGQPIDNLEVAVVRQVFLMKFPELNPECSIAILNYITKLITNHSQKNLGTFLTKQKQEKLFNFHRTEANQKTLGYFLKEILGLDIGSGVNQTALMTLLLSNNTDDNKTAFNKFVFIVNEYNKAELKKIKLLRAQLSSAPSSSASTSKPAVTEVFSERAALYIFEGDHASPSEEEFNQVCQRYLKNWRHGETVNFAVVKEIFILRFQQANIPEAYQRSIFDCLAKACSGPLTKNKWLLLNKMRQTGSSVESLEEDLIIFLTQIANLHLGSAESRLPLIQAILLRNYSILPITILDKLARAPLANQLVKRKPIVSQTQLALAEQVLALSDFRRAQICQLRDLVKHHLHIVDEPSLSVTDLFEAGGPQIGMNRDLCARAALQVRGFSSELRAANDHSNLFSSAPRR